MVVVSTTADREPVLLDSWSCCSLPAGAVSDPAALAAAHPDWIPAPVPGTVARALEAAGRWRLGQTLDFDAVDWWYRTAFARPGVDVCPCRLCFDGLAMLAEIWLNGRLVLTTNNMFRSNALDAALHLQEHNELVICFRSLSEDLKKRRPRPRWKTGLVNHQQLRWHRSSLLGRIPGWSPPVPAIGPYRAIRCETQEVFITELHLTASLEGDAGQVSMEARVLSASLVKQARLRVGDSEGPVEIHQDGEAWLLRGSLSVPNAPLWWPHTHGAQALLDCSLRIQAGRTDSEFACGKIGFRQLAVRDENGFGLVVNGAPIYCRGACWTISDIVSGGGTEAALARELRLARDAGMNMLRVGGTMTYESDTFYRLCDELGILVWQDFMFANMDYPVEDPDFAGNIEAEAKHQLKRLSAHPCVAVYCGNSEVEQQAAMLGMPRETWRNRWFAEGLPELYCRYHPGTAYVPSTPSGGVLPFHVGSGLAHYYAVGAYLRSPSELRRDDVKFAAECLGFANIPEADALEALTGGSRPVPHHPQWKQRTPRDTGAGWDFDDVRDHYLRECFGVDPVGLRSYDPERYLQLSRVVSGEMMGLAFSEWRSGHSNNRGGLVWFFKDLWPGAGFGIVDSLGQPKAAYYCLRRHWLSKQIVLTDEGMDGLDVHAINESAEPCEGFVEVLLLKDQHVVVARREVALCLAPRSCRTLSADEILGGFFDVNYAYRFGPPGHDVVVATLLDGERRVLSEAFHFVSRHEPALLDTVSLEADAEEIGAGRYQVTLHADRFLRSVRLVAKGFLPEDNYFHLVPGRTKTVIFSPEEGPKRRFAGEAAALNLRNVVSIRVKKPMAGA